MLHTCTHKVKEDTIVELVCIYKGAWVRVRVRVRVGIGVGCKKGNSSNCKYCIIFVSLGFRAWHYILLLLSCFRFSQVCCNCKQWQPQQQTIVAVAAVTLTSTAVGATSSKKYWMTLLFNFSLYANAFWLFVLHQYFAAIFLASAQTYMIFHGNACSACHLESFCNCKWCSQ